VFNHVIISTFFDPNCTSIATYVFAVRVDKSSRMTLKNISKRELISCLVTVASECPMHGEMPYVALLVGHRLNQTSVGPDSAATRAVIINVVVVVGVDVKDAHELNKPTRQAWDEWDTAGHHITSRRSVWQPSTTGITLVRSQKTAERSGHWPRDS